MEARILGFQFLKEPYKGDKAYCPYQKDEENKSKGPYIIHNGFLFKVSKGPNP